MLSYCFLWIYFFNCVALSIMLVFIKALAVAIREAENIPIHRIQLKLMKIYAYNEYFRLTVNRITLTPVYEISFVNDNVIVKIYQGLMPNYY